jgi:hypothetical protein
MRKDVAEAAKLLRLSVKIFDKTTTGVIGNNLFVDNRGNRDDNKNKAQSKTTFRLDERKKYIDENKELQIQSGKKLDKK